MVISIILKYFLISILISLIFGALVLSNKITYKIKKGEFLRPYFFQLLSLLIFIVIWIFNKSKIEIFEIGKLFNWNNVAIMLLAIIPTSDIASLSKEARTNKLPIDFIHGSSMEIPQRLLIQNMFVIFNVNIVIYRSITLAIILNSLIWVQFIIVQELISGRKITKKLFPSIIASAWFSIWAGILYSVSGNIIVPMITHGVERMVTNILKNSY